jgi:hypothetical protein
MNIGIVGARKYQDRQSVIDLVMSLPADATIISSSCKGVCTLARDASDHRRARERTRETQLGFSLAVVIVGNAAIKYMARNEKDFQRRPTRPSFGKSLVDDRPNAQETWCLMLRGEVAY